MLTAATHRVRYAVIGLGALGGFYGGLLARAGREVHFLARSDVEHVAHHGLRIDSVEGDFNLARVCVYSDPADMPACDVVLVAVKATDNRALDTILPQVLRPGGAVVLIQNGLGQEERLPAVAFEGTVYAALGFICATKVGPGHIHHMDYGQLRLAQFVPGRRAAGVTDELRSLADELGRAGVSVELDGDYLGARWRKLVWNIPFNGLSVVLRTDTGRLVTSPSAIELIRALMSEVVVGAKGEGRTISRAFVEEMILGTAKMCPYVPSMSHDYDRGRAMEIDAMYWQPVARAAQAGVAMPLTRMLAGQLEFLANGRSTRAGVP